MSNSDILGLDAPTRKNFTFLKKEILTATNTDANGNDLISTLK